MKIALASDHGGYILKEQIKDFLQEKGYEFEDLGTDSEESVDYPIYGKKAAHAVADGTFDTGIVCCGTGIGISIAANKVKGIRCAIATNAYMAEMTRRHNDANMLALGGRVLEPKLAVKIVETFLETEFEGGRHQMRIDMLEEN